MLDSIVAYFLVVMSASILNSTLKNATNVLTGLIIVIGFVMAYVIGEFAEINRVEFVIISTSMVIFLFSKIFRGEDVISELPLACVPLLFVFDQRVEYVFAFKMLMLSTFYLFSQKKLLLNVLANIAICFILFLSNNALNPTYQIELISFIVLICLLINVMSIPETFKSSNVLYNCLKIFLLLKLLEPHLLKFENEQAWQITFVYTVFLSLVVMARMLRQEFEQQQLIGVSVVLHHVGHALIGINSEKTGIALLIFLVLFLVQIFKSLDNYSKPILITLSFVFLSYEVISLNLSTISLVYSIVFKVMFIMISDLKNHNLLSRKVAII